MARVNQIIIDYNQKMVINDETDIHKLTTVDQQSTAHTLFIRRINHGNSELIVINICISKYQTSPFQIKIDRQSKKQRLKKGITLAYNEQCSQLTDFHQKFAIAFKNGWISQP